MKDSLRTRAGVVSPEPNQDGEHGALVRAAQVGDRLAFEQLVGLYDRPVLRLARSVVHSPDEAEDLYQETFLKIYRALPRFRFECSFYTWVYRIATNTCLDYLRRQTVRREVSHRRWTAPDTPDEEIDRMEHSVPDHHPVANPEQLLLSRELETRIGSALDRLNPRERMVFELKHYQGLKLSTIGDILDTSEATAKNALFRATQKLRLALADLTAPGTSRAVRDVRS